MGFGDLGVSIGIIKKIAFSVTAHKRLNSAAKSLWQEAKRPHDVYQGPVFLMLTIGFNDFGEPIEVTSGFERRSLTPPLGDNEIIALTGEGIERLVSAASTEDFALHKAGFSKSPPIIFATDTLIVRNLSKIFSQVNA